MLGASRRRGIGAVPELLELGERHETPAPPEHDKPDIGRAVSMIA
jgi:hypothetical protein